MDAFEEKTTADGMLDTSALPAYENSTDYQLAKIGKKAVLRQNFNFFSMLSLSATTTSTWEGMVIVFAIAFNNGGYLGSFIGILFVFVGTLCSIATMAEMVSMAPTAGGQYHWVAILAPKSASKILSYLAAWLTIISWQAAVASVTLAPAQTIQGMVSLGVEDYMPQQWQIPLIYWGLALISLFFNTVAARYLPQVEIVILVVHIAGFFATIVPLLIWAPKTDPSIVFGMWENTGGWSTQALSFLVGLYGTAYSFSGGDSATHMVEEVGNAAMRVPQAMIYGVILNGIMAISVLLTLLFCLGDPNSVLNTDLAFPAYQIYYNAVGSVGGTLGLISIILFNGVTTIFATMATASRATWAFARDGGLPGWRTFSKIDPKTTLPLWSIALTLAISFVLSMIPFGSLLAFNDIVALSVTSCFATYLMGNALLLWRRLSGHIKPYDPKSNELTNTVATDSLSWGPWKLPEPIGIVANIFGIIFLTIIIIFSFFPGEVLPDSASMNWNCLMFGVVMLFSVVWYFVSGHKHYRGPKVDRNLLQEEAIVTFEKDPALITGNEL